MSEIRWGTCSYHIEVFDVADSYFNHNKIFALQILLSPIFVISMKELRNHRITISYIFKGLEI